MIYIQDLSTLYVLRWKMMFWSANEGVYVLDFPYIHVHGIKYEIKYQYRNLFLAKIEGVCVFSIVI
jgi:hypothetical protein